MRGNYDSRYSNNDYDSIMCIVIMTVGTVTDDDSIMCVVIMTVGTVTMTTV
jgi:hypothetical protein